MPVVERRVHAGHDEGVQDPDAGVHAHSGLPCPPVPPGRGLAARDPEQLANQLRPTSPRSASRDQCGDRCSEPARLHYHRDSTVLLHLPEARCRPIRRYRVALQASRRKVRPQPDATCVATPSHAHDPQARRRARLQDVELQPAASEVAQRQGPTQQEGRERQHHH